MHRIHSTVVVTLVVLAPSATGAAAQTNVPGGTLATDTTWTLAGSPYIVEGALTVIGTDGGDGVTTLTIEPGVEVRFQSGGALVVGGFADAGALVADGDAGGGPATIVFTSDNASPSAGAWRGIETENIHPTTILRNVEIRFAGQSGRAGVYGSHDPAQTLTVDQATIRDCSTQGVRYLTGRIDVSNSTIQDNTVADVQFDNSSNLSGSVSDSTLGSVRYQGQNPDPIGWSNNTFVDYGAISSRIDVDDLADFSSNNTFTPVAGAVTQVIGGTAGRSGTWTLAASPYVVETAILIQGDSGVPANITIEPGVEMRFDTATAITVGGSSTRPGNLVADGNATGGPATILFTTSATTPAPGAWRGLETEWIDATTVFRNIEVRYAGQSSRAGLYLSHQDTVTVPVEQVTVRDSATQGIRVISGGFQIAGSTIQDNPVDVALGNATQISGSFTNNTMGSVQYSGLNAQPIQWSGNTFVDYGAVTSRVDVDDLVEFSVGNTFNKVANAVTEVLGGTAEHSGTWGIGPSPYVVLGLTTIQGSGGVPVTITIAPGVELRFDSNTALIVGGTTNRPGALIADGNGAGGPATILFTANSGAPTPGFWRGVETGLEMDGSSVLRNVQVRYAGALFRSGVYANHREGTTLTMDQVTLEDGSQYGMRVVRGDVAVTDCLMQNNAAGDVRLDNSPNVSGTFSGNTLGSVEYFGTNPPPIVWSNNSFLDYGAIPSLIDPDDLADFSSSNTFVPVVGAFTRVFAGTAERSGTWTLDAAPYHVEGVLNVQGDTGGTPTTITIEPGVEMRFDVNGGLEIGTTPGRPATLIADGDGPGGPATIVLTANTDTPSPGFWRGVLTGTAMQPATVLRNVEIRYPGALGRAGVYANHPAGTTLTLDRVTVRDASGEGYRVNSGDVQVTDGTVLDTGGASVRLTGSSNVSGSFTGCLLESVLYDTANSGPVTWSGNTFDNWGARTSKVRLDDLDGFIRDNTFNAVPGAILESFSGILETDATWGPAAGPIVFDNSVDVRGTDGPDGVTTLTLEPGVTVRLPPSRFFRIGQSSVTPGELIADGAPGGMFAGTINFGVDSDTPNAGDWNGVDVLATGRAVLRHVQVRYATEGVDVTGTLGAPSTNVTVNRSNVGLDLDGAVVEGNLDNWSFRNTDVGVRASSTDVTFRDGNLIGATFGAENLTPATHCIDAEFNWWNAPSGPSGSAPAQGCETETPAGTGSAITEGVLFGNFLGETPDDGDTLACDDGDGFPDPCTGGNTVGCDDNCCGVSNESQADEDGDGVGDACDSNPVLRVSSDPADGADFEIVQDAVDVSVQSGTRVEILPGLGPYLESVRVDRSQVYSFVGVTNANEDPIVVDGGTGPAFRVINKVGTAPMAFDGLTLRGGQGVRSSVDTAVEDVVFDVVTGEALQLDGGSHTAERVVIGPTVVAGARVENGASLDASRVDVRGATDAGFDADGALSLDNVLIAAGVDGVRLRATGSLDARYVTITDNTGVGVDASAGGTVNSIDRSIVYANGLDDLVGVACGALTWTDTGTPDCSSVGNNLSIDPLLDANYRLQDGSACLDHGPGPETFTGDPPTDLDGGVRIADWDGDGAAIGDCGAYEEVGVLVPGDIANLRWDFNFRLLWDADPDAVEYHVYRDLLSNLAYTSFGACRDDLDADRTDLQLDDAEVPAPGTGFFYLITAEAGSGEEGTLGYATAAERSNFNACP